MSRILVSVGAAVLLVSLVLLASLGAGFAFLALGLAIMLAVGLHLGPTRFGTLMAALAMFTAPMSAVRPAGGALSVVTASDVFFVLAFLTLLPSIAVRRFKLPPLYQIGALIVLVSGLATSALTPDPVTSLSYLMRLVAAMIVLPAFIAWWRPDSRTLTRLAMGYVLGQLVSFLGALANGPSAGGRYEGLTTHPNFFGLCSVLAASLTLFLIPRVGPKAARLLVVADIIFLISVSMSGSRAALITFVAVALAWILLERSTIGGLALLMLATLGVAGSNWLLSLASPGSALSRLAGDRTAQTSDGSRVDLLRKGFSEFVANPVLGRGFENTLESHNIYLQVAVAAGAIGLIGYLLMLGSFLQPLVNRAHPLHVLCYPVLAYALVGMLANSLWDRFIWAALCLAALAMTTAGSEYASDEPPPDDHEPDARPARPRSHASR